MDEPGNERRGETRAPITLKVEYKRLNSFFADYTRNISKGGTFIRTERPLPIGTEFHFELQVPKMETNLVLRGKVQWVVRVEDVTPANDEHEPGMGIGFVYVSEAERERVQSAVEKLLEASLGTVIYRKLFHEEPQQ